MVVSTPLKSHAFQLLAVLMSEYYMHCCYCAYKGNLGLCLVLCDLVLKFSVESRQSTLPCQISH